MGRECKMRATCPRSRVPDDASASEMRQRVVDPSGPWILRACPGPSTARGLKPASGLSLRPRVCLDDSAVSRAFSACGAPGRAASCRESCVPFARDPCVGPAAASLRPPSPSPLSFASRKHPLLRLPQEVDGLTTRLGPALSDLRPRALLSRRNLGKLALAEQRGDVVDLPHNVMLKQRTRPLLPARTGEQLVNKPLLALERSPRALPGVWADPIVLLLPPLCPPPSPPPHP